MSKVLPSKGGQYRREKDGALVPVKQANAEQRKPTQAKAAKKNEE